MNKDPLKHPRSDALNPSLSKEGDALFIVGGIRWIKRCSWWGWHVVSVPQCVCHWASLSGCVWFSWHPEYICVYNQRVSVFFLFFLRGWAPTGGAAGPCPAPSPPVCQLVSWTAEEIEGEFYFFFHRAFHVLTDECVYWLRNENQLWLVSQIIQLY